MKVVKFKFLIALFAILFSQKLTAQKGYEIKVKVDGLKDTVLILGYHMDGKTLAGDTAVVNHKGEAVFKGEEPLFGGLYFIFLPSKNIFNILIGKDQKFSLHTSNDKPIEKLKFSGSEINTAFLEYESYLKNQGKKMKSYTDEYKAAGDDEKKKKKVQEKIKTLNEEVTAEQNRIIEVHKGTFLAHFLRATQTVEVPDAPKDLDENKKRKWQYQYYKKHFFDNFNFADSSLVRTALLKPKLTEYLEKVLINIPDSIIKDLEHVITKSKQSPETFKYILASTYNHYNRSNIMGMDKVWLFLADYYLRGEAYWGNEEQIKKIRERADKIRPNLIGETAFDFTALTIDHKWIRLNQIKADYTILFFFEPDCSHCNKEAPRLREVYKRIKKRGVAVVGFFTKSDTIKWFDFNKKHNLKWLHVWSPHSNEYRNKYNIYSTPTMYLLDENKEIIAKRVDSEQMEKIILELQLNKYYKKLIKPEMTKEQKEEEQLKFFDKYMTTCTDTTETRILTEVMKLQNPSDEGKRKIDESKKRFDKVILIDKSLTETLGESKGKERIQKLKTFIEKYEKREDFFIIKQLMLMKTKDMNEAQTIEKIINKKIK